MAVSVRMAGVTKRFGDVVAVDDVSLDVEPGELFFLLGPSGCGKTTLLRCVAGFHLPEAGSIAIGDHDITRLAPHQRDTGMVFQSYALWPHMRVRENVAFGLQMRGLERREVERRVTEVLELVRMSDRAARKPNELSGGQQQRVALARALVVHPRCLLLDEPLSNLDAKLRLEMRTEIRRICKQAGLTAIYVTHDQKEALSVADRVAVMNEGRVVQLATPIDLYRRPRSCFVAGFVGETNFLPGTIAAASGGGVIVDTSVGQLSSARTSEAGMAVGDRVTVSVRPEAVRLGEGRVNVLVGMVQESVYLGEAAQHLVALPASGGGGAEVLLKVHELNPRDVSVCEARRAALWVDPEDVVVLTE